MTHCGMPFGSDHLLDSRARLEPYRQDLVLPGGREVGVAQKVAILAGTTARLSHGAIAEQVGQTPLSNVRLVHDTICA
jgi:hypothetical protein